MLQKIINKLNDLRPRQLLILACAAAFLMFVTLIVAMNFITKQEVVVMPEPVKEEKPIIETTSVVTAKVNIPPRTRIQENMLEMKEVPNILVPEGAITSFDDVKNVQIKVSIFSGDILTIQKVFNDTANEGFIGSIPSDCRAVSISVSEITGVAGFAKPGDRVDLLLAEKTNYSATTNILLQNVPLLSVNQDTAGSNIVDSSGVVTSSAISNPTIATFALPPQDVLKLISASKLGEIYMMLRPSNPTANYVPDMEYTIDSISKPRPETPAIPSNPVPNMPLPQIPAVPVAPPVPKIDIILGDEIVQSSQDVAPAKSAGANSALPAIPSGGSVSAPQPDVPLSNVPVMNQIRKNL
ncbi:MAG: Flp pilus assembly protein CpaB [Quinella sp. 3Q1]|nr:Flp pilus assembly protein CpaB [Quinella sp. 3Q1]MBR3051209.1 Flp pilus assembly protein CpaB [Selenomonadaceae bacterium]MBR6889248.1 Flp pilus assembly protein CpaB [Selenomonadaceae bacterium]